MKIIVEKGDSISSIAKALNTTTEEIKRINKLTTNILSIGDELTIEEDKKIEKINIKWDKDYYVLDEDNVKIYLNERDKIEMNKINKIIDYINNKG